MSILERKRLEALISDSSGGMRLRKYVHEGMSGVDIVFIV
jgi:hypothetical protein